MRDLDAINPGVLKPSKFAGISAAMLLLFVLISLPLANGAAPSVPFSANPLVLSMLAVCATTSVLALLSVILRWGWRAQYYGVFLFSVAGISFLAVIPCSGVLLYGKAPLWIKIPIAIFYVVSHIRWCQKFSFIYRRIFNDETLRSLLFNEEVDAVYYMRKADNLLLQRHFKFSQIPRDRYFLLFMALAFAMIPVMGPVREFIGLPFVHIFLLIAMLPVSWMSVGLAFRAYLIFYYYPTQIKKQTGKDVYVDLETRHSTLGRQSAESG